MYFACNNYLCRGVLTILLGTYSSAFCHIWALKKAFEKNNKCQREPKIWVLDACIWLAMQLGSIYDISIFLKWGILNVPFCSIFVSFHFYLVMALVVPCLENIFMVCWSLNLQKLVRWNLFFWILVPLRGEGGSCMRGHGLLSLYRS